jgi:hypothetical protein
VTTHRIVPVERTPTVSLRIQLTRRADGSVVFALHRADGTTTWQKRTGPTAEFFAVHDLTHLAVESVLGLRRAFYGLVLEGWELGDFGHPWPRGPLPPDALAAEVIVGCFDTQRAAGERLTAEQCNASAESWFAANGGAPVVRVTDAHLDRIRAMLSEQVWQWQALAAGGTLEVEFLPPPAPPT